MTAMEHEAFYTACLLDLWTTVLNLFVVWTRVVFDVPGRTAFTDGARYKLHGCEADSRGRLEGRPER